MAGCWGSHLASTKGQITRTYESDRNLLNSIENEWDTGSGMETISKYTYRYDDIGRRKDVVYSGTEFGSGRLDKWGYNTRNELTTSDRHAGTKPDSPGANDPNSDRIFAYDPIGNRSTYTKGAAAALYYCANQLNQYDETGDDASCTNVAESFTYDEDGNLETDGQFSYTWDAENREGRGTAANTLHCGFPVAANRPATWRRGY